MTLARLPTCQSHLNTVVSLSLKRVLLGPGSPSSLELDASHGQTVRSNIRMSDEGVRSLASPALTRPSTSRECQFWWDEYLRKVHVHQSRPPLHGSSDYSCLETVCSLDFLFARKRTRWSSWRVRDSSFTPVCSERLSMLCVHENALDWLKMARTATSHSQRPQTTLDRLSAMGRGAAPRLRPRWTAI